MKKPRKKKIGNGRVKIFTSITKSANKVFVGLAKEEGRTIAGQYRYCLEEMASDFTAPKITPRETSVEPDKLYKTA